MPELPEVEVLRQSLIPLILQKKIRGIEVYYPKAFSCDNVKSLENTMINEITRRGKYLLFSLHPRGALVGHLRMTGKLIYKNKKEKSIHDHFLLNLSEGYLYYNDIRKFGGFSYYNSLEEALLSLSHLGIEPFDERFNGQYLYQKTRKSKKPIKNFLLDQKTVVGLGNIYADEVLFVAGIRPEKSACKLSKKACYLLSDVIRDTLRKAVILGGSSIKDYSNALGNLGQFQNFHQVYGRGGKSCKKCDNVLKKIILAGRSTVFCPHCQK